MSISVLILTLNEEKILPECLASVAWSDDIVVLDSFSTDRTVEIARASGARVVQRRFDDERTHRTFSLREIAFKHPWVYNPDADEITPPELRNEMLAATSNAAPHHAAFRVRRKDFFMGKWIKHSSLYPTWFARLFRPEAISFNRSINLEYVVSGEEGKLRNHMLHFSFNKGIEAWLEKHNKYSRFEAEDCTTSLNDSPVDVFGLFDMKDPVRRRRILKEISFHLPLRPTLRFIYMYLFRLGILDGRPGYTYCRLLSIYEYMIVLKMAEIRRREKGLAI